MIDNGCHGVVLLGSTGQSQLISISRKNKLISSIPQSKNFDKFIIGTGSNSLGRYYKFNENFNIAKF